MHLRILFFSKFFERIDTEITWYDSTGVFLRLNFENYKIVNIFKGNYYIFRGGNCVKIVFFFF